MIQTGQNKIDILAVVLDIGLTIDNSTVFQSQVVDQLIALKAMGYEVGILCVYSNKGLFFDGVGKQLKHSNINIYCDQDKGFIKNFIAMFMKLRLLRKNMVISNCYVRGVWGALLLIFTSPKSTIPYLYDVRGDLLDEGKAVGANSFKTSIYIILEKIALKYAENVSTVSSKLKILINKRIGRHREMFVIPSCINYLDFGVSEKYWSTKREELGFSKDDIVLIYSGGLSHYQKVPEMLELWRRLHSEGINIKFILLTNTDPHSLPSEVLGLERFGPSLKIFNLPRGEVYSILHLADIAFLLRDDRTLNKAASPVKFAEYIASGLAVIGSPSIGDVSSHIRENNLGMLISPSNLDEAYNDLLEFIKSFRVNKKSYGDRSKAFAKNNYDWQCHREKFIKIYGLPPVLEGED